MPVVGIVHTLISGEIIFARNTDFLKHIISHLLHVKNQNGLIYTGTWVLNSTQKQQDMHWRL